MSNSLLPDDDREKLRTHFLAENSAERWDNLWKNGFLPWDRGLSNPALVDLLSSRHDLIGSSVTKDSNGQTKRKRALVPGCGRGYDVLLLASFGYDAVGLDGSETAIDECKKLAQEEGDKYPLQSGAETRGSITFLTGDFFKNDWETIEQQGELKEPYDLIYDYTFLCALPPDTRPSWALRISELLSTSGRLVCLEFPLYKDPSTGGPPYALREETYVQHLSKPGQELEYKDGFVVVSEVSSRSSRSLVRLDRWKPERTHKIGEGTDHISVWAHK